MRTRIELERDARLARRGAPARSATCGPPQPRAACEDARLLVSELVTNAIRHAGLEAAD
jgi:anti-sigma regulatory factor (Ser/Thr protein kinase)